MPGQVHWATEAQTTFLISRFSEYVDIYKNDKKYGPFWAKIKEEWLKLFPLDAGSMFPEKSAEELTPDDEAAVGKAIKKLMQVPIMINDGDIFTHNRIPSNLKNGSVGV